MGVGATRVQSAIVCYLGAGREIFAILMTYLYVCIHMQYYHSCCFMSCHLVSQWLFCMICYLECNLEQLTLYKHSMKNRGLRKSKAIAIVRMSDEERLSAWAHRKRGGRGIVSFGICPHLVTPVLVKKIDRPLILICYVPAILKLYKDWSTVGYYLIVMVVLITSTKCPVCVTIVL